MGDLTLPVGHAKVASGRRHGTNLSATKIGTSALATRVASYGCSSSPLPAVRHAYTLLVMQDDWGSIARLVA